MEARYQLRHRPTWGGMYLSYCLCWRSIRQTGDRVEAGIAVKGLEDCFYVIENVGSFRDVGGGINIDLEHFGWVPVSKNVECVDIRSQPVVRLCTLGAEFDPGGGLFQTGVIGPMKLAGGK